MYARGDSPRTGIEGAGVAAQRPALAACKGDALGGGPAGRRPP